VSAIRDPLVTTIGLGVDLSAIPTALPSGVGTGDMSSAPSLPYKRCDGKFIHCWWNIRSVTSLRFGINPLYLRSWVSGLLLY
jgi:hypothetical protein